MHEKIKEPPHYTAHPSGVECIEVAQHFNFNLGNVIKYVWRAGQKTEDPREDLLKARQYIEFELERLNESEIPIHSGGYVGTPCSFNASSMG